MKKNNIIIFIVFLLSSCGKEDYLKRARSMADDLFEKIETGSANGDFSEKYFPLSQTEAIMYDLKNKCDFANRKGGFIEEFKVPKEANKIICVYEYYLKCDSIRFILTYKIDDKIELYEFKLESMRKKYFLNN